MDVNGPPFDLQLVEVASTLISLYHKTSLSDWQIERFLELSVSLKSSESGAARLNKILAQERFGASFNFEAVRELAAKIESSESMPN